LEDELKSKEQLIRELKELRRQAEERVHESEASYRTLSNSLRESERLLQTIVDTEPECVKLIDSNGCLLYMNPAGLAMIQAESLDQVKGECICPLITSDYRGAFEDLTARVFKGESGTLTFEMIGAKGRRLWLETHAVPLRNEKGEISALLGITRDITDKKRLEEDLSRTQKLESLGVLAGGIAHDFNNLLQGIFGYMSMARQHIDDREKACAMLDQAEKALTMSVNLTSQLLTFSKGGKPAKKRIALQPIIDNSARFALSGSHSDYRITADKDLWHIDADEGQIGQVIQNIVQNASEAMPDGGTVDIRAGNEYIARGSKPLLPEGGRFVKITVRDTGTGIPAQHQLKIFDPYFTTKQKGSGLGLATSYSIVRNHGGMIELTSESNKGSTFSIYLPAGDEEEERKTPATAPVTTRRGRVLVMDDEEMIRNLAMEMIGSLGHEVTCAVDGKDAIEKFLEARESGRPFDAVILDLTIRGGMGGEQVIRKLLEIDPTVKALVSSGYSDSPVMSDYSHYGFAAFLSKPYRIDALRDSLNALLGCS